MSDGREEREERKMRIEREMQDMQVQRHAVQNLLELNKAIFESAV